MDPAPFDSPDTDITLRTMDGTLFRVYSRILAEGSPFFRDLLTLPQPLANKDTPTAIVDVPERSEAMHKLLMFLYPVEDPPIETLSLVNEILAAAIKYDMGLATQKLRRLLVTPIFIEKEPCRVYAIACRHNLEEEMKLASTYTLTVNLIDAPLAEELKFITAFEYHKLLKLHQTRVAAAQRLLDNARATSSCCRAQSTHTSRWWVDWSNRASEELRRRPTTDVIFSMPFLAESLQAGCLSCGGDILKSHKLLSDLKRAIDDLPATV